MTTEPNRPIPSNPPGVRTTTPTALPIGCAWRRDQGATASGAREPTRVRRATPRPPRWGPAGGTGARIPDATEPHPPPTGARGQRRRHTRTTRGPATTHGQTPRVHPGAEVHGDVPTAGQTSNRNQHTPGARGRQHTGTRTHRGLWSKSLRDPSHHEARNRRLGSKLSLPSLTAEASQQRRNTTQPGESTRATRARTPTTGSHERGDASGRYAK